MAFNIPNAGTIDKGQSFIISYSFGGQNKGAQFAEGNPENPGATLISDQEGITMTSTGSTTYQFQLTNTGSSNTVFGVDGGGLS